MEQCRVYQSDTLKSILTEGEDAGESLFETALRAQLEDVGSPTRSMQGKRRSRQNSARSLDSLRSATGTPSRMQMHDSIDELTEPGRESESAMSSAVRRKQESMATLNAARLARYQKIQAEIEEEGKRRIEHSKARAERRFNYLYDTVFHGMLDPAGVIPQVDSTLNTQQRRDHKRTERLYQEWKEGVYDPIHSQLKAKVDKRSMQEVQDRNQKNYSAYLSTLNTKGSTNYRAGLFRDTIIATEYDPMATRSQYIKINTRGIVDPLKRDLTRHKREKAEMGMDVVEYGRYPGRSDMFDVKWYDKAVDTPSGHFSEPDGSFKAPPESLKATAAKNSYSRVNMDHYNTAVGAEVMLAEQVRTGGKVEEVGHRKGRPNFHEVVGHMHNLAPKGTTGGDQWLEYKGKGSVQAPGDPNRSHLYHVLHQTGDHKAPGGHGDLWLSQKGKLGNINPNPPPGSRRDLFEVVHQSDGRLVPGRSPGDTWIEAKGKSFMPGCGNYPYDVPRVLGVGVVETSLRDNDGKPTIPRSGLKPMSRHQQE